MFSYSVDDDDEIYIICCVCRRCYIVSIAADGSGIPSSSYTMSFHDTVTAICVIFVVVVTVTDAVAPTAADDDDDNVNE